MEIFFYTIIFRYLLMNVSVKCFLLSANKSYITWKWFSEDKVSLFIELTEIYDHCERKRGIVKNVDKHFLMERIFLRVYSIISSSYVLVSMWNIMSPFNVNRNRTSHLFFSTKNLQYLGNFLSNVEPLSYFWLSKVEKKFSALRCKWTRYTHIEN